MQTVCNQCDDATGIYTREGYANEQKRERREKNEKTKISNLEDTKIICCELQHRSLFSAQLNNSTILTHKI